MVFDLYCAISYKSPHIIERHVILDQIFANEIIFKYQIFIINQDNQKSQNHANFHKQREFDDHACSGRIDISYRSPSNCNYSDENFDYQVIIGNIYANSQNIVIPCRSTILDKNFTFSVVINYSQNSRINILYCGLLKKCCLFIGRQARNNNRSHIYSTWTKIDNGATMTQLMLL